MCIALSHDGVCPDNSRATRSLCDIPDTYRSSRSSVGMPCVTLRVTDLRSTAYAAVNTGQRICISEILA
ncbi:hypothetical protein CCL13_13295 [Pseudomonas syringae]|nr:hypothetical protein CCL13_13295 [Pseudomonas syringae]